VRGTSARPLFQRFPPPSRSHPTPLPSHLNSLAGPSLVSCFPVGVCIHYTHNLKSRDTRMSPLRARACRRHFNIHYIGIRLSGSELRSGVDKATRNGLEGILRMTSRNIPMVLVPRTL
jgi:hypothetical protein